MPVVQDWLKTAIKIFAAGLKLYSEHSGKPFYLTMFDKAGPTDYSLAIPLWAVHGDQNDVRNVKYSRLIIAAHQKHKGKPIYTEYPGVKHNS